MQDFIRLTTDCHLRCQKCPLVDRYISTETGAIKSDKKIVNLIGGDPFKHDNLIEIISKLHKDKKKIRLWTHGVLTVKELFPLIGKVDTFFLFCPFPDNDRYLTHTGVDGYLTFLDMLAYLSGKDQKVVINVPVTKDNVATLPDIYEIATKYHAKLLIHYQKSLELHPERKRYIHRFFRVKNVWVIPNTTLDNHQCQAVPYQYSMGWEILNRIRDHLPL